MAGYDIKGHGNIVHPASTETNTHSIKLEIDIQDADEVFEILCGIPFELPTMGDSEPPTERQHGIESMIKQIGGIIYPDELPADEYFCQ